jgi:hypothetical protein
VVAAGQIKDVFTMTDATDKDLAKMADLYSDELSENVLEPPAVAAATTEADKINSTANT